MTAADRRKLNRDAGFSLLELLIAVVILAIIVIPLLNLFLSSNKINIKSRQTLRATTAAQDIMEGLKAYNIEEVKTQFADPASGFYVIDSRLIKGDIAEETTLEEDGFYVFSMKDINMQGSKFDAKIEVDGRGYMTSVPAGTAMKDHDAHLVSPTGSETYKFNDGALADARSIDKNNGTFVETEKIRQSVLKSVFKDSDMKNAIEAKLKARGVADADLDDAIDAICFKSLITNYSIPSLFDKVSRTITIVLTESPETDEEGDHKVDMKVKQEYTFVCKDINGADVPVTTCGDIDSVMVAVMDGGVLKPKPYGSIAMTKDNENNKNKININLFYYPLYGASASDKIIIENNIDNSMDVNLDLLIAKQRHETSNPTDPMSDPEYLSDAQLMNEEKTYGAEIEIGGTHSFSIDKFSLKTNLGLNLVGEKYLAGSPIDIPTQFTVTGKPLSQLNIFTLDGVRSALGKPGTPGEGTELIYDVKVSVYEEGAAASGFPDDKRMVVIGGSMMN